MKNKDAENLVESVGTLLRLFTVDETKFPSAEGRMRYNPIDFQTLRFIDKNPDCRGADIARALGVAPTTQQSALDRLIRKGFVARQQHPTSRKAKTHILTPDGQELRYAIQRQDKANMQTVLGLLEENEQKEIVRLLEKVARGLSHNHQS